MAIQFEWDDEKSASNRKKHGISFEEATLIFDGVVVTNGQYHEKTDEYRELSFGLLGVTLVLAVIHTHRQGKTRIISARKATKQERKFFYDHIKKTLG